MGFNHRASKRTALLLASFTRYNSTNILMLCLEPLLVLWHELYRAVEKISTQAKSRPFPFNGKGLLFYALGGAEALPSAESALDISDVAACNKVRCGQGDVVRKANGQHIGTVVEAISAIAQADSISKGVAFNQQTV